jgi:hypothetical protein
MNFGFNSNVGVGSDTYHVQTEDRGPSHPFLDTVVYLAGRVVYKRSTGYEKKFASGTEGQSLAKKLHELLSQQHREVIAELEAGTLLIQGKVQVPPTVEAAEAAANEGAPHDGLDLRLLNPNNWFAAGNVVFEIELREKNSEQRVGDADVQAFLEQERQRIPFLEVRTDAKGSATLKFPMPANVKEGSCLVVRATDGSRYGELRFRLKPKTPDKTPAPASR